jgi:hypothetical protein
MMVKLAARVPVLILQARASGVRLRQVIDTQIEQQKAKDDRETQNPENRLPVVEPDKIRVS